MVLGAYNGLIRRMNEGASGLDRTRGLGSFGGAFDVFWDRR